MTASLTRRPRQARGETDSGHARRFAHTLLVVLVGVAALATWRITHPEEPQMSSPAVQAHVDELAALQEIGRPRFMAGGLRSPTYARYDALSAEATPQDMALLLHHPSPVVRFFAASYHLERGLDPATIASMTRDRTLVEGMTLGQHIMVRNSHVWLNLKKDEPGALARLHAHRAFLAAVVATPGVSPEVSKHAELDTRLLEQRARREGLW